MAVDLTDLVETLKRAVNVPGGDTFDGVADSVYVGYLSDAFWELRMLDMLTEYTESDGLVAPLVGTTEIPREMQQLIVLYAAIGIVTNELKAIETLFRAKAGPVEFETQKNGALLRDILAELQRRRGVVELALSNLGRVSDYYIDSVVERTSNFNGTWWLR